MQQKNHIEEKIFWLIAACIGFVFVYITLITFAPIPKDNVRFADTSLGFLLGTILAGCIGYYIGGSPLKKGSSATPPQPGKDDEHEAQ